jgi:hypothetical protein
MMTRSGFWVCLAALLSLPLLARNALENKKTEEPVVDVLTVEKLAQGFGAMPFFITDVSKYQKCRVLLYHDQKSQVVFEQNLKQVGNEICLAISKPPSQGRVVMAWKDGYRSSEFTASGAFNRTFGYWGHNRMAAGTMPLFGTTITKAPPRPSDFRDMMWCFVVEFE